MKKKRITIYDMAEKLGISPTTISRALRGQQGIAKATIARVQRLAREMEYSPNTLAAGLRTKKSYNIGVLVPQIDRAFIATFISGIEEVANEAGYSVMIFQSMDDPAKEKSNANSIISNYVDGVIVSLAMRTENMDHIKQFIDQNIPLVMADRVAEELDVDKVVVDNFNAAFSATEYLINSGHQRIAHLGGSPLRNVYYDRKEGYLSALKKYRHPFRSDYLIFEDLSEKAGIRAINQLIRLEEMPDAIFCANDTVAVSAVLHLQDLGYKVPDDISVIGFNNDPISSILKPKLSTIGHPARELGQTAAQRLLTRINADPEKSEMAHETFTLSTSLIIRESTKQPIPAAV